MNAVHVGAQIKALRQSRGWSLQKLSEVLSTMKDAESEELIKVGRGALGKWETGDNKIPVRYLVPLSIALGTTPTVLLLGLPEHRGEMQQLTIELAGRDVLLQHAYEWAYGERPLDEEAPRPRDTVDFVAAIEAAHRREAARHEFRLLNRPHEIPARLDIHGMLELERVGKLDNLREALTPLFKAGLTPADLQSYMEERYIEELPGTEVATRLGAEGWENVEEIETAQGEEVVRRTDLRGKGHSRRRTKGGE